ncbi:MAG: pentapeptide repeat-containing protein [Dehalococcoidia bacterium]|nr:pentapeptide repeat-containing protein [Dehalococcoidia bacterium]
MNDDDQSESEAVLSAEEGLLVFGEELSEKAPFAEGLSEEELADLSEEYPLEEEMPWEDWLSEKALSGADLSGADLSGANLGGANLAGAELVGATANANEYTRWPYGFDPVAAGVIFE